MSRPVRYILGAVVAIVLLAGAFSGGLVVGWLVPARLFNMQLPFSSPPLDTGSNGTPADLETLFQPFWQAWQIVTSQYVDQPVDTQKLMRGAIRGMLLSLGDAYTAYMEPSEYQQSTSRLNNEYEGIGAWVDTTGKQLKIISAIPGSPAEKAGLQPGDIVLKVDGKDMAGLDGATVLTKVLGPANTKVLLTIQRQGAAAVLEVSIVRAKIIIPSVETKMLDGGIAYVKISTFGDQTSSELKTSLTKLMAQHPKGLILDLRNNGGGYLITGIEVISQFVAKGEVMYEVAGDGTRTPYSAAPGGLATDIPMLVLVNKGSASASEITAGAIQDLGRGKLVGETTFGKGEVQKWFPLGSNNGAIRVTIARWITPKGRQIQGAGLTPDVEVKLSDEDVKNQRDPQLDQAVKMLSGTK